MSSVSPLTLCTAQHSLAKGAAMQFTVTHTEAFSKASHEVCPCMHIGQLTRQRQRQLLCMTTQLNLHAQLHRAQVSCA